jgi:hypothetical protein
MSIPVGWICSSTPGTEAPASFCLRVEPPTPGYEVLHRVHVLQADQGVISISCSLGQPSPGSGDALPGRDRPGRTARV